MEANTLNEARIYHSEVYCQHEIHLLDWNTPIRVCHFVRNRLGDLELRKERNFVVFRLFQQERELIRNLGRGSESVADRHQALRDLVPIVEELNLPDIRNLKRKPIRIGIPEDLDAAIREVSERTGQTYTDVLLAAAREYRRRYPYCPDPEE